MPRIKRGLFDGLIYHVFNRGNNSQEIFHKDQDFVVFIELMKEAKRRYPISILAYCLMPNHFHLVLWPTKAYLISNWMQWLMNTHVRRYHKHYGTSGHIWQGRFKCFIIQRDRHLLTILRYVERNPVRAKIVNSANDWPWSSHRMRITQSPNEIIDNVPIELPSGWDKYVDNPLTVTELEQLRKSVNRQRPFGNLEWQNKICSQLCLEHTLKSRGRPRKYIQY